MGQDLKAENLTISLPNNGCNKNCPYCVSRMTGFMKADIELMERNLPKVVNVAEAADVTSILFTGKGEPTLDLPILGMFAKTLKERWPLELQTNGIVLLKEPRQIDWLFAVAGIDVLAISMDRPEQFKVYPPIFRRASELGMITRITVNITSLLKGRYNFTGLIAYCMALDIRQLTLRKIIAPEISHDSKTTKWIEANAPESLYNDFLAEAKASIHKNGGRLIRQLANGVNVYDVGGVSFSYSDYCIQERSLGNNVRSLVFQEDGHLYTSWGSRASVLF
jgi:organic radical activating enzyme